MTPIVLATASDYLAALLLVCLLAMALAIAIDRIRRWWLWEKQIKHVETPTKRGLANMAILPPHKSAARPSNVMALARKPVQPNPRSAA